MFYSVYYLLRTPLLEHSVKYFLLLSIVVGAYLFTNVSRLQIIEGLGLVAITTNAKKRIEVGGESEYPKPS